MELPTLTLLWSCAAMFLSIPLFAADAPTQSQPSTQPVSQPIVEMIFWENQIWKPGGGGERLTLWADGRSEISVRRFGGARKPKPGWTATAQKPFTIYSRANPLSKEEATQKFTAALAAGIQELQSFPPGYSDGGGTLVGIQCSGELMKTTIPEFMFPDRKDNQGSENHKRFLAVQKAIGDFDADAVEP